MRLFVGLGSTECGSFIQYPTDPAHWNYYHFHASNNIHWHPVLSSEEQSTEFELILHRDSSCNPYQGVFHNFPDLDEWSTKDVFRKHPSIPDYWEYRYRVDDLVVFSTGEKMNPIPVESRVNGIPGIKAALVIGPFKEAVGIENGRNPRDGQIDEKLILIAVSDKAFARTPKGTVNRNQTLELYKTEINELYRSMDLSSGESSNNLALDLTSQDSLASDLTRLVERMMANDSELDQQKNVFATGLDSRQAEILASVVGKALARQTRQPGRDITVDIVYRNPTPRKLAEFVTMSQNPLGHDSQEAGKFQKVFQRYSKVIPHTPAKREPSVFTNRGDHVLLTGTTGGANESKICLQRFPDDESKNHSVRLNSKVADLSAPFLGLSEEVYYELQKSVTHILHCQWAVDFNRPLDYFEPNIKGLVGLIQFAHTSKHNPQIIFLSSIATVVNWKEDTPVPEETLRSPETTETGYGTSKLIASLLLDKAANSAEASAQLGCLPETLGIGNKIEWIPVDTVAELLSDLICTPSVFERGSSTNARYYNLVNPHHIQFSDIVPLLAKHLGTNESLKIVPLRDWVHRLSQGIDEPGSSSNPGLRLLGFFQGLARSEKSVALDTTMIEERFPRLGHVGAVNDRWINLWLEQWGMA
ncbi:Male sterility NAD-binding [Penicillium cf. griseofulvum]|nr:Male sterility NAD-binding [Penicillium cf. griseofulvum]